MEALLYESEIEETLIKHSCIQYGIESNQLIPYLFRRYWIVMMEGSKLPKMNPHDFPLSFMRFWLHELAIPITSSNTLEYKGVQIPLSQSLRNIYDNLLHQYHMYQIQTGEVSHSKEMNEAKKEVEEWLRGVKTQVNKYRKSSVYPFILKQRLLERLNGTYHATVSLPTYIQAFHGEEIPFALNEEIKCERHLIAFQEHITKPELVKEKDLERYVIEHIEEIESGLQVVKTQLVLPNGRIDVLARDQNGIYVVMELKVKKDTDSVWQKWYYTEEVKKRYGVNQVRFLLILPQLYPEIIEPILADSTPTTILQFHPILQRGRLTNVQFTPYENRKQE